MILIRKMNKLREIQFQISKKISAKLILID
jgi:hypothetical protein